MSGPGSPLVSGECLSAMYWFFGYLVVNTYSSISCLRRCRGLTSHFEQPRLVPESPITCLVNSLLPAFSSSRPRKMFSALLSPLPAYQLLLGRTDSYLVGVCQQGPCGSHLPHWALPASFRARSPSFVRPFCTTEALSKPRTKPSAAGTHGVARDRTGKNPDVTTQPTRKEPVSNCTTLFTWLIMLPISEFLKIHKLWLRKYVI